MFWKKAILGLVVSLGLTAVADRSAQAANCWFGEEWFDSPPNVIRECLHRDMQSWYGSVAEAYPFEWWNTSNGNSGTFSMYHWLYEDDFLGIFDLRYNLTRHGFTSSLDDLPLGHSVSTFSFTFEATETTALYMGITLDEFVSNVQARGRASLTSATLSFELYEEIVLTERLDSKALFLSSFADAYGESEYWGYGGGVYVSALGTRASLSKFHANVASITPVPLPPALPLLLGGLAGLGWLGRRRKVS